MRTPHAKSRPWRSAVAALVAVMFCAPVFAQTPSPEMKKKLIEQNWGRLADGARMFDSQLEAAVPKSGVKVTKDQAYGKDPRQKVDVYQPEGKSNMPILV